MDIKRLLRFLGLALIWVTVFLLVALIAIPLITVRGLVYNLQISIASTKISILGEPVSPPQFSQRIAGVFTLLLLLIIGSVGLLTFFVLRNPRSTFSLFPILVFVPSVGVYMGLINKFISIVSSLISSYPEKILVSGGYLYIGSHEIHSLTEWFPSILPVILSIIGSLMLGVSVGLEAGVKETISIPSLFATFSLLGVLVFVLNSTIIVDLPQPSFRRLVVEVNENRLYIPQEVFNGKTELVKLLINKMVILGVKAGKYYVVNIPDEFLINKTLYGGDPVVYGDLYIEIAFPTGRAYYIQEHRPIKLVLYTPNFNVYVRNRTLVIDLGNYPLRGVQKIKIIWIAHDLVEDKIIENITSNKIIEPLINGTKIVRVYIWYMYRGENKIYGKVVSVE